MAGRTVKEVEGQRHAYLLTKFVKSEQVYHNLFIPEKNSSPQGFVTYQVA